eukprot:c2962_g1_i1.p1 GENE.c2962_g1_i1~~c2962_g1_i1.p1  ORF type:complete len:320 (-),score=55.20 c2962_g1_i1:397-1356(-)
MTVLHRLSVKSRQSSVIVSWESDDAKSEYQQPFVVAPLNFREVEEKRFFFTRHVGEYRMMGTIGEGGFGKVKLAKRMSTKVAIKCVPNKEPFATKIRNEAACLRICQGHTNIVTLHDVMMTKKRIYLVFEHALGDLFEYITGGPCMREKQVCQMFHQILSAVAHMHSCGVGHRDIKPENILVCRNQQLKVCDFGFAIQWRESCSNIATSLGSIHCLPPEMIRRRSWAQPNHNPFAADVWSCGVVLFFMLACKYPFDHSDTLAICRNITKVNYTATLPEFVSGEARDMIKLMLTRDIAARPSAATLLMHPFFDQLAAEQS